MKNFFENVNKETLIKHSLIGLSVVASLVLTGVLYRAGDQYTYEEDIAVPTNGDEPEVFEAEPVLDIDN